MPESSSDPYGPIAFHIQEAIRFAEENKYLGLALLLEHLAHRADWRFSLVRTPAGVAGVSIILTDGTWWLEAKSEAAALLLAEIAGQTRLARVLSTSESAREWLHPRLDSKGRILQESRTILVQANAMDLEISGSWATAEALPSLEAFWNEIESGNRPLRPPAWRTLIAFEELAILSGSRGILAAVACSSRTQTRAGLSLYRLPPHDGQGEAVRQIVAFVAQPLIAAGKKVFAWVDSADPGVIDLYRSMGFAEVESKYRFSLKT